MPLYYRTLFDIDANDDGLYGLPLMADVEDLVRRWAADSFPQYPEIRNAPDDDTRSRDWADGDQRLHLSGRALNDAGYFWLRWNAENIGEGSYNKYLGFRLSTEGGSVQADIEVRVEDGSETDFESELSEVLDSLLAHYRCSALGTSLSTLAEWVETDAVTCLWNRLASPERCLPMVVVSERRGGGIPVDGDSLQRGLLGLATVAVCSDEASWQLGYHAWRLMCYDGQVRVYSPRLGHGDDESRHRSWSADEVEELSATDLIDLLRDECSRRIHYPQGRDALRIFSRVRMQIWRSRIMMGDQVDETLEELSRHVDAKNDEVKRETAARIRVENANDALRVKIDFLEKENRRLQLHQAHSRGELQLPVTSEVIESVIPARQIQTVVDAVEAANNLQYVRVFDRVPRDCRHVSKAQARDFYGLLFELDRCGLDRLDLRGQSEEDWMIARGFKYAGGESPATMQEHGESRNFLDNQTGERVEMKAHIRLGNLRVYLQWSPQESAWLVGYFGNHLRIASQ